MRHRRRGQRFGRQHVPVEKTANGSTYGGYVRIVGDGIKWNVGGTMTFPIGNVLVTLTPNLSSRAPIRTISNDGLTFSPNTPNKNGEPALASGRFFRPHARLARVAQFGFALF